MNVDWDSQKTNHVEANDLLSAINDWFSQNPDIKKYVRVFYLRPKHRSDYTKHKKYPFVRLVATVPKNITITFESEADAVLFWLKFYTAKPFDFSTGV